MASIADHLTNNFLHELTGKRPAWIGGYGKLEKNSTYPWRYSTIFAWDDGTPWKYSNWADGEQNDKIYSREEAYVQLSADGHWNVISSWKLDWKIGFICQMLTKNVK